MMDYIVQELSTTERFAKPPFSTLVPVINRYSLVKKSKPASSSIHSDSGSSIPIGTGLGKLSTSNLEQESPETNPPGSYISNDDPQRVVTFVTTTPEPKLFEAPFTSGNVAGGGKKRVINYKNPKLPHLVLMTSSVLPTLTPSTTSLRITGTGKPSPELHYSLSSKKTNSITPSVDYLRPQVFPSGSTGQGDPQFSPWSPNS